MPNYKAAFPSKYLKADDLGSRRVVGTIRDVALADIGTGANAGRKLVTTFEEHDLKALVLNRINCETIAELAGTDDFEHWGGTPVQLFAAKTEFQGKRVPCIRIEAPTPTRGPATPPRGSAHSARPPEPDKFASTDAPVDDDDVGF